MDSIIQSLMDCCDKTAQISLVLPGSFVDVMRSLLGYSNPLYGRVGLTIDLKQMDYYESSLFYLSFSSEDKVKLYSVFGGIPYYNCLIDEKKTVNENIIDLIASPLAPLENEISMYLCSEIAKTTNANEVFQALAKGYSGFSDILSQSHVSSSPALADALEKLMGMEMVEKVPPSTIRTTNARLVIKSRTTYPCFITVMFFVMAREWGSWIPRFSSPSTSKRIWKANTPPFNLNPFAGSI